MSFNPLYYPYDYHSAYRPIVYRVTSPDYLPPSVFTASAQAVRVRLATSTEVGLYGISSTDVVVEHTSATFYNNELVALPLSAAPDDLSGTSRYPGTYRVTRVLSDSLMVVAATYVGIDTVGGFVCKVKGNYTVFAVVSGPNIPQPVEFSLKPLLLPDFLGSPAYIFELDCRDVIARHFKDIKNLVTANTTAITDAEGYISMKYNVRMYAGYDVVSPLGVVTFTRFDGADETGFEIFNQVAVNAIHPYHHTERDGTVDLDWADSFSTDYVMNTIGVGGPVTSKRFLSYMDRDLTTIRSGDAFFLAFLWQGTALSRGKMRIRYADATGTILSTADIGNPGNANLGATSYIANVGLAAHTAPAGAVTFQVYLINGSTSARMSEIWTFNIEACKGINKRWYYLNKLGGVDAFTFQGDETRQMSVRRDILSKPNMAIPDVLAFTGQTFTNDYQTRVWRTTPQRKYTISSGFLLPKELRVVAEEMFESANIFTEIRDGWWTNIIPITTETAGDRDSGRAERFVIQYQLGVDNVTQRT